MGSWGKSGNGLAVKRPMGEIEEEEEEWGDLGKEEDTIWAKRVKLALPKRSSDLFYPFTGMRNRAVYIYIYTHIHKWVKGHPSLEVTISFITTTRGKHTVQGFLALAIISLSLYNQN